MCKLHLLVGLYLCIKENPLLNSKKLILLTSFVSVIFYDSSGGILNAGTLFVDSLQMTHA